MHALQYGTADSYTSSLKLYTQTDSYHQMLHHLMVNGNATGLEKT